MSNTVRPVEQQHLRVDPGFGQNYFYRLESPEFIITSPNVSYLPSPPPHNEKTNSRNYTVFWRYPRFIPDNMPHLAFLPKQPVLSGPIFRRLDVKYSTVPIVQLPNGRYILHTDVINSWHRLEAALWGIQDLLLQSPHTNYFGNLDMGDMPYQCGYQCPHKSEGDARYCAIKSRDAFIVLAALCSFAISFYRTRDQAKEIVPPWHRVLMPKSYHAEWLELLEATFVCDFSRGTRVGGYIHANATRLFPQIRAFLDSNVPLWIEWHIPNPAVVNQKYGSPFLPKQEHIQHAIQLARTNAHNPIYGPERSYEWVNPERPSFYHGGEVPYDEAFDNELGMIPGNYTDPDYESDSDHGRKIGDEDEDMDSVLEHPPSPQAVSRLGSPPPAPRPSLPAPRRILPAPRPSLPVTWTQSATNMPAVHAGSGQSEGESHLEFFSRRATERAAAVHKESQSKCSRRTDMEAKAKRGHKVHLRALFLWKLEGGSWVRTVVDNNNISKVWAQFPSHLRVYSYDHNEWDICPFVETADDSGSARDPPPAGDAPSGHVNCAEDLNHAYDTTKTAVSKHLHTRGLKRLLQLRYGFTVPEGYKANPPCADQSQVLRQNQREQARFRLHGRSTDDFRNDEAVREMWNSIFLTEVAVGLPHRFDMSPHASFPVSVIHKKLSLVIVPAAGKNNDSMICLVGVRDIAFREQWFLLAFRDFATVVQIFRERWTEGILHAGRQLLQRGIPFNTVIVRDKPPATIERECLGLGHRPVGYIPQLRDYAHYESQRYELLREHEGLYARVALKMGGLYWRLAMEDADDSEQLVKKAMKSRPFARPVGQVVAEVSPTEFLVDDQLSPAAAAVLSGLYVVDTSIQNQVEHVSWWPKQETWYQSELNVGYWSEACEDWYQQRLADIREGRASMMNATAWRNKIKGKGAHIATFKDKFSVFAENFVNKNGKPLHVDRRR